MKASISGEGNITQDLVLHAGMSTDQSLDLVPGYTMLVHEILGDLAATEGAAAVIADVHNRNLVTKDCVFVPRKASTMIAPTAVLDVSTMDKLVHRWLHNGSSQIQPLCRYSARFMSNAHLVSEPQPLEVLDFAAGPELIQIHTLEFRTNRECNFDGVHMHLLVDLDDVEVIDALALHSSADQKCSWSTTYVKLVEEPISLSAGAPITCHCTVNLEISLAQYKISVKVGEAYDQKHVADFEWEGG